MAETEKERFLGTQRPLQLLTLDAYVEDVLAQHAMKGESLPEEVVAPAELFEKGRRKLVYLTQINFAGHPELEVATIEAMNTDSYTLPTRFGKVRVKRGI